MYRKTGFFVGWAETRSPTAVVDYAPNFGLRTSAQPTKDLSTPFIKLKEYLTLLSSLTAAVNHLLILLYLFGLVSFPAFSQHTSMLT